MNTAALFGALLIGLSLGLTGAGGSILTLPVLVFLAGVPPAEAVGLSLLVVGSAALAGALQRARAGEVHWKAAGWFGLAGMAAAAAGARFTSLVAPEVLLLTFAGLMIVVGLRMWLRREEAAACGPDCRPLRCFLAGAGVGFLTGFLGVGGGFLLLPALSRFARLPLASATGTSLAIIAFNSAAGFWAHWGEAPARWPLALTFSAVAIAAVLGGGSLARRMPAELLRRGFAGLVLLTACALIWQALA